MRSHRFPTLVLATATLISTILPTEPAGAQLVDDTTPWWLWAESWSGPFSSSTKFDTTGSLQVKEDRTTWGTLQFDHKQAEGCEATWTGSNSAQNKFTSSGSLSLSSEAGVAQSGSDSSDGGQFELSPDSHLKISMETGGYDLHLTAATDASVPGSVRSETEVNTSGVRLGVVDSWETVDVEFDVQARPRMPTEVGPLDDSVVDESRVGGGFYRDVFRWSLLPFHETDRWWAEYVDLLELQRADHMTMWKEIRAACEEETISGSPCRAADSALVDMDDWIARLGSDCDRILRKLLNAKCPGFAVGMRRSGRWDYEDAVCSSPAKTCDVIHRHVWDHFDAKATGELLVTYRRLPGHLQCLYNFEDFSTIAVISRPDFWSRLLGQ